eukprot:COSAG01_NODE_952_length_12499_cov_84.157661_4_plen_78_part_00
MVVDNVLSPLALQSLLRFTRDATIWHEVNAGYLGAYFEEGFNCPLLLQVLPPEHTCPGRTVPGLRIIALVLLRSRHG